MEHTVDIEDRLKVVCPMVLECYVGTMGLNTRVSGKMGYSKELVLCTL